MLDDAQALDSQDEDDAVSLAAGTVVVGAYHCAACGYGVMVRSSLPVCPMCSGTVWQRAPSGPFRAVRAAPVQD